MDEVKAGVQYIFQTKNPMTFALSATGHAAMETVMVNMLEKVGTACVLDDLARTLNSNFAPFSLFISNEVAYSFSSISVFIFILVLVQ